MPPRPPTNATLLALLNELANRPAMNGGFAKLAAQQDDQCARLVKVETWIEPWEKRFRQIRNLGWAVFVGLVVVLVKDWIGHVQIVLH